MATWHSIVQGDGAKRGRGWRIHRDVCDVCGSTNESAKAGGEDTAATEGSRDTAFCVAGLSYVKSGSRGTGLVPWDFFTAAGGPATHSIFGRLRVCPSPKVAEHRLHRGFAGLHGPAFRRPMAGSHSVGSFKVGFYRSCIFNNLARFVFGFAPVRFRFVFYAVLCFQSLLRFVLSFVPVRFLTIPL